MALSVEDFRLRDIGGTFAAISDAALELYLADAAHQLGDDPGRWGDCYDLAQMYLTAHLLSTAAYGATGGPISSASAGGLAVSFGSAGRTGGGSTRWRDLLSELALACGLAYPMVIVGQDLPCETRWR